MPKFYHGVFYGDTWFYVTHIGVTALLCVSSLLILWKLVTKRTNRLPPGPKPWPVIGNMLELRTALPHHALLDLSRIYGPIMHLKLGSVPVLVVSNAEMAEEILRTQDQVFAFRPRNILGEVFNYDHQGIIHKFGEPHRLMRKTCSVELFAPARLASYEDDRSEELLGAIGALLKGGQDGEVFNIHESICDFFFNVVTRVLISKSFYGVSATGDSDEGKTFRHLIDGLCSLELLLVGNFIPSLRWMDIGGVERQLKQLFQGFDKFLQANLEEHRCSKATSAAGPKKRQDFVDVLLNLQSDPTHRLNDVEIKAFLQDLLIAGVETGSTMSMWTLGEFLKHPDMLQKVREEIDAMVGKDRMVQESDLVHFKYLQACLKESFRLHPPTPLLVPHAAARATKVAGYDIAANTQVFVNAFAIGRDPKTWENPLEFNPERFLNSNIELKGQNYQLLPFGAGRRICPGLNLGLLMLELNIAAIIHAVDFSLPSGMEPEDCLKEVSGLTITVKPMNPLKVHVKPRLPAHVYRNIGIKL